MQTLLIFLLSTGISFLGSVQLGPVNLSVIARTIQYNLREGRLMALGGCLPEIFYSSLALLAYHSLFKAVELERYARVLLIPLFFLLGIWYLFKRKKQAQVMTESPITGFVFLKGFALGMANPQLFPFWLAIYGYLQSWQYFSTNLLNSLGFIAGTATGALLLLYLFAEITSRYREKITQMAWVLYIDRIMGLLFVSLSLLAFFRIYLL